MLDTISHTNFKMDEDTKKKTNKRIWFLIGFLVIAVIALLIAVIVLVTRDNSAEIPASSTVGTTESYTAFQNLPAFFKELVDFNLYSKRLPGVLNFDYFMLDTISHTNFKMDEDTKKKTNKRIWFLIGFLVIAVIALLIAVIVLVTRDNSAEIPASSTVGTTESYTASSSPPTTTPDLSKEEKSRIDCYPEALENPEQFTVDEGKCIARGCSFDNFAQSGVPKCYIDSESDIGSGYISGPPLQDDENGIKVRLSRRTSGSRRKRHATSNVIFEANYYGENILGFKLYPENETRYEVPRDIVPINLPPSGSSSGRQNRYKLELNNTDGVFFFKIIRKSSGAILWDTSVGGTSIESQLLTISTRLPSNKVYGFGENSHLSFQHDMNFRTWGLFARDELVGTFDQNHYGVHPFYTCLENEGHSHGVLLLNSNAMDYSFTPLPMLTYRTIGGILDFYMFLGPSPENVIQQYLGVVGKPYMPPYWSLGFQLCRYGYNNLGNLTAAVDRTINNDFPLDVQYADIDTYDVRKVFTIDPVNFGGLSEYFSEIRSKGIRTVTILDPALIINNTNYEPHDRMLAADAYVKWPSKEAMPEEDYLETNSTTMLGFVWPMGKVAFPDYLSPKANEVWEDLIIEHSNRLPFDGLWIDMNEPANFGTNVEKPWNWPDDYKPYWSLRCPDGDLEDPPYPTMAVGRYEARTRISDKTLCMTAKHRDGQYDHYDVHNLYGTAQIESTLRALRNVTGERGLVVGRSTFVGAGRHVGHWLGDNFATWESMRMSIVGMLEFNLFGIPYIGADICGFFGDTNLVLCKRWTQLGAFYPYARSHNHEAAKVENDPGFFAYDKTFTDVTREALRIRYKLLPYLYTLFHNAHTRGNTVIRPVFHEFPTDENTASIDRQFLWGSSLLISPILDDDTVKTLSFYLPRARWFNYHTGQAEHYASNEGSHHTIEVKEDTQIPLHVRGGSIIPTQDYANNTKYSRKNPFRFLVYLDNEDQFDGKANGDLFWDDGVSTNTFENGNYYYAQFESRNRKFIMRIVHTNNGIEGLEELVWSQVTIHGVAHRPSVIILDEKSSHYDFEYESSSQVLKIKNLNLKLDGSVGQEIVLDWDSQPLLSQTEMERINCLPDTWRDLATCEQRNCILAPTASPGGVPRCYIDVNNFGYNYVNSTARAGKESVSLKWIQRNGLFGGDFENVTMDIIQMGDHVLRIKIYPTDVSRYEVPIDIHTSAGNSGNRDYEVEYETDTAKIFSFKIKRTGSNTTIWDTSVGGMAIADQFLQIVSRLPTTDVYGIGENEHKSFKHDFNFQTWPLFSRDQPPSHMANLYGVHPYYTCIEDESGRSHGVFLLNSNAMEIGFQPSPQVTYRTVGGILDFYYIFGDNPEMVTQRYTELIGRPYLPPYWSLGFQLCRYGYNNLTNLKAAVERTIQAEIPFDVQYGDIDHFEANKDFTYDKVNFAGMPEYFQELRDNGMRTIIILDPALLAIDDTYEPFTDGEANKVFIKWPTGKNPQYERFKNDFLHGVVWPVGESVFPDYHKNETKLWWKDWIVKWHKEGVPFDGLWIDMNEPANFDTNADKPWNWPEDREPWNLICPKSKWDDPPYKPDAVWGPRLSDKTICMVGTHDDGNLQYDTHSLFGTSQIEPTISGLREAMPGKRGLVISRSTYPSAGTGAGHWLGDNASIWPHLHYSIIGILEFNLFGIPYIGADICGFFNDVTNEMCQRWMQLGAFYTFARNHNGLGVRDQDPGFLGPEVATSSRQALETRYRLLPYLYTLHYRAHVDGNTVTRPLHHEFYLDRQTLKIDRQFLWGAALLISPVLEEQTFTVDVYFPKQKVDDVWYDYYTGTRVKDMGYNVWDAPLDYIPLHIRGGYILPTQQVANTTYFSRQKPLGLIMAPDKSNLASGELFWDDGESIDTVENEQYSLFNFKLEQTKVNMTIAHSSNFELTLGDIRWFEVDRIPAAIRLVDSGGNRNHTAFHYNNLSKELKIYNLSVSMQENWEITLLD